MELNDYISAVLEERVSDIHTISLGKIIALSGDYATVKPLYSRLLKDGSVIHPPVINKVPIMRHRYRYTDTLDTGTGTAPTEDRYCVGPEYLVNDVVVLAYSERAVDAALTGSEGVPAYSRKHAIDDAIIIGLIGAIGNV